MNMEERKDLRARIRAGEVVLHAMLRLPDPAIAEIIALSGVDYITVDNEHFGFNDETIQNIIRAAGMHGVPCMVRVTNLIPEQISRVMDMGAIGVLAPQVDSYEEAVSVVQAVKFAPEGRRGFCPISRAASYGYGIEPADYAREMNRKTIVGLMIESKAGIEDLDRILTIDEIDCISVGPSDVSNSYGYPGQIEHPVVKAAIDGARSKILAAGKSLCGLSGTPQKAVKELKEGSRGLLIGSDLQILTAGFETIVQEVKKLAQEYR